MTTAIRDLIAAHVLGEEKVTALPWPPSSSGRSAASR